YRLRGLGGVPLGPVPDEDLGPILGPSVIALTHALGRVVVLPEDLEELLVRDLRWIADDAQRLRMRGLARARLVVRRVRCRAALVPDRRRPDARLLPERLFLAPEAAERELRDVEVVRIGDADWRDGV